MRFFLGPPLVALTLAVACDYPERTSPSETRDGTHQGGGGNVAPEDCAPSGAEQCGNGVDDDCDGESDCDDWDCQRSGDCGQCGSLDLTEGEPLALPDGVGGSYETSIDFTGFSDGQQVVDESNILSVCVVMEHSWLRDLEIEISCPTGETIVLQKFLGTMGGLLMMGVPDDTDGVNPVPGVGAQYCWAPDSANPPMLEWGNQHVGMSSLPPGDYQSVDPFATLVGCTLNGAWTIKVTDLWAIDNGFIFSWGINFDPNIVEDCDEWPVE